LVEGYEEYKASGAKGGVLAGTSNVSVLLISLVIAVTAGEIY
jgi:hypothetical protein